MSLKLKTIIGIAAIELVLLAALAFTSIAHLKASNEDLFQKRSSIVKQLFATMVSDAVISLDLATLDSLVDNALKNRDILYVRVRDSSGQVLVAGGQRAALATPFRATATLGEARALGRFDVRAPLVVSGSEFGSIELGMSVANAESAIQSARSWLISISSVQILLVGLFGFIIANAVTHRVAKLQGAARQVADGEFGIQVSDKGGDELAQLARDFNRMSVALAERQTRLQASETRLTATVGAALDGVIIADARGTIIEFNKHASDCFGYSSEYAVGRDLADLIIPERMRAMHSAGMSRYLETGDAKIIGQRVEIEALHADGHEIPVELVVGVSNTGGEKLFVAYVRDISRRRENERELVEARKNAEAADDAKSRFLAVMSHEMRTPLNGITGVLQLLRDTQLNEEQNELIDTADRSGEVLLDLINDVLDLSKMEAGKLHLNTSDFHLDCLLKRVEDIIGCDVASKGNKMVVEIDRRIPRDLHGDEKRLCQILLNLASNANKFTNQGKVEASIQLISGNNDHVELRFSVRDNGVGIPEDKLDTLFSEFTSLDNNYDRRSGGTGLGLSICQHLVGLMDSKIGVHSRVGEGSEFWFDIELPVAATEADEVEQSTGSTETEMLSGRLLLAEDNATNRMVARKILTKAGFDVDVAINGEEAVAAARQQRYDLILMDISMPELDGMEATRLIRELPNRSGSVPIVAMTAHALSGDREKFISAGMDDYVTKPIRKKVLLEAVTQNLSKLLPGSPESMLPMSSEAGTMFQPEEFNQLRQDVGDDVMATLLDEFSNETREGELLISGAISTCNNGCDFEAVRRSAHSLKGSAATIGAVPLAKWASQMERAAERQDTDEILTKLAEFPRLREQLEREANVYVATAASQQ